MDKQTQDYLLNLREVDAARALQSGKKDVYLDACKSLQQLAWDGVHIPWNAIKFYFFWSKWQQAQGASL